MIAAGYKDGSATNGTTPAVLSYDGRVTPTSQTVRMPYEPGQSGGTRCSWNTTGRSSGG